MREKNLSLLKSSLIVLSKKINIWSAIVMLEIMTIDNAKHKKDVVTTHFANKLRKESTYGDKSSQKDWQWSNNLRGGASK